MKNLIRFFLRAVPRPVLQRIAPLAMKVISLFLRGNNFEDPISGIRYRKMLPYGRVNPRPNALAPDTMSLERHRLLWLFLKDNTNFFTAKLKFLHVAPEMCFLKKFKKMTNLDYTTADLVSPWADIKMNVQDIPFPDNTFDAIMCNHVLEHVDDEKKALGEFYRVLKPDGWGIFQVPIDYSRGTTYEDRSITDPLEREKHFWQDDHMRLFGRDYPEILKKTGFAVTVFDPAKTLTPELVRRYALPENDPIYFCTKPGK